MTSAMRDPEPFASVEELLLTRTKVAARARLSPQLAHDAAVTTYVDRMSDSLVVQLQTEVLRHKVDVQDVRVPFSRTETVEIPAPKLLIPVGGLLVLLGIGLGFATSSVALFLVAMASALAFVVLYASNPSGEVAVTVEGDAVVHREQFNAFPESTVVYPPELGGAVRVATWTASPAYSA